mgnify:CR=1 FL=1
MPNRMLRDWTNSDKVDKISAHAEAFFTRLIMKADDFGCFWADAKRLKANLYPLKSDSIRETDLLRWMAECHKAGLIVVYQSDGKEYLQIIDFNQRLRIQKSKFPLPNDRNVRTDDGHLTDICPPEVEVEVEEKEGKDTHGSEIKFPIERCLQIAMMDPKWKKENKPTEIEISEFMTMLTGTGEHEKNPADFKRHFYHWKKKLKTNNSTPSDTKLTLQELREMEYWEKKRKLNAQ